MEYVLRYTNGLSRYLIHSGVKGMKWGVWNAETAAKYSAKAKRGVGGRIDTSKKNHQFAMKQWDLWSKSSGYNNKAWHAKHRDNDPKKSK